MSSPSLSNTAWLNTRIIRNRITIEHTTPFDRQFSEEISVINNGNENVNDIPIPLSEFRHGLKILDQDNSILSFYSVEEIEKIIRTLEQQLQDSITSQLSQFFLLWIKFPDDKPIHPKEIRTIRLVFYSPTGPTKSKTSFFDDPIYTETIPKGVDSAETFYFISAPKDFVLQVSRKKTYAKDEINKKDISIEYEAKPENEFRDEFVDIINKDDYISARFPTRDEPYKVGLNYQVKLSKVERRIWKLLLPISAILLASLILYQVIPFSNKIQIDHNALFTISGSVITIASALIALVNNPLIRLPRSILFFHIFLAILLLLTTGLDGTKH